MQIFALNCSLHVEYHWSLSKRHRLYFRRDDRSFFAYLFSLNSHIGKWIWVVDHRKLIYHLHLYKYLLILIRELRDLELVSCLLLIVIYPSVGCTGTCLGRAWCGPCFWNVGWYCLWCFYVVTIVVKSLAKSSLKPNSYR